MTRTLLWYTHYKKKGEPLPQSTYKLNMRQKAISGEVPGGQQDSIDQQGGQWGWHNQESGCCQVIFAGITVNKSFEGG